MHCEIADWQIADWKNLKFEIMKFELRRLREEKMVSADWLKKTELFGNLRGIPVECLIVPIRLLNLFPKGKQFFARERRQIISIS